MEFTYYGHACFAVKIGGKNILFDPFITPNELAKAIDINTIPADYILVSHGHSDHMIDVESIANRTGAKVIASFEVHTWFNNNGVSNTHPLNPGGQLAFDFGRVKCFTAVHSSSMPDGSYGGVATGFAVKSDDGNFYYSGDTALTMDMQLVPRFADLNYAVLPIGDDLTMGIDDAIGAAKMVGVKTVVGVHYNTFGFIMIDTEDAKGRFEQAGIKLLLPAIGETITI
ncbi:metal-dependent hydrolase [Mucilaginibacter roseus]|uniref:Metal-dependent hydrolase n=1 Tax=Mucilaginibacter roseus TaxID=1528868 RepID=A0ABS8U0S5_9SPHI|nr:metal-dependent hydrolase [Mucilaginibacter roseus]MCD8739680.1 metal-dependent hydrolase [Mucilaginibacter roseus]